MNRLKYIIIPILVIFLAQICKSIIYFIKNKRVSIDVFVDGMGGMPSAHASCVSSLTCLIYLDYGIYAPIFSIVLIFSLIVMYDAMGIRYESGLHANIINKISNSNLKENIGHRPIEVLVGVIFGIVFSLVLNVIIK